MEFKEQFLVSRRRFLRNIGLTAGVAAAPLAWSSRVFAEEELVIEGPEMPDIPATEITDNVYVIVSPWGFPSEENQGMMSNVTFAITEKGVVVIDSGASLQIGRMALRQIRKFTDKPIAAVFNTHYHGDHWLGNHAFVEENPDVPIYAHERTASAIRSNQGDFWVSLMERSTGNAIEGTVVTPPNKDVEHGDEIDFGDLTVRVHFYGTAHTPSDISLELVEKKIVHVGDIAMNNRIAFMDDGSFQGTFKAFDKLEEAVPDAYWVPAHGFPAHDLIEHNRTFFRGIYESAEKAVEDMAGPDQAKAYALEDDRVKHYAPMTSGFNENIGKYASLAFLEAEAEAF
ncbi:MAG: MBL fold metallo-hydrolase [Guyparkeria sp.]|uniref:MBL fold metallo-hydrolase n=1 Tax=Guyparkeria sp. TaxID=2035736 RepID=UPI00397C8EED